MTQYLNVTYKPTPFDSSRSRSENRVNVKPEASTSQAIDSNFTFRNFDQNMYSPYDITGIPKDYAIPDQTALNPDQAEAYKTDAIGGFSAGRRVPGSEDPNASLGHSDFTGYGEFDYNLEDTDPWTSPYNPISTWRHFRDIDDIEKDLKQDIKDGNRDNFARHMHQGQDYYVHYSKGYRWYTFGHLFNPEADNDDAAWAKAEQWTQSFYNQWIDKWGATKLEDYMIPEMFTGNDKQGGHTDPDTTTYQALKKDAIHVNQNEGDPDAVNGDCGPATVLMAVRLAGGKVEGTTTIDKLTNVRKSMYLNDPRLDGLNDQGLRDDDEHDRWTSMNAMRTGLDTMGLDYHNVIPKADYIEAEIESGNPVILAGHHHFVIAGAYDATTNAFTIYDSAENTPVAYSPDDLESFMDDDVYGIAVQPYNADMALAA